MQKKQFITISLGAKNQEIITKQSHHTEKNKSALFFSLPLHLNQQKTTERWSLPSHTEQT